MICTKCILPDSVPGICFNEENICNFCLSKYPDYKPKGDLKLQQLLNDKANKDSGADCLVGLSGGKDSTYSLVMLRENFNMKVEAFTYVHDGSTSFSVENAKNACKKFGIKHHIVSLKDHQHLKTFTGFFEAWLKAPSPTTAGMTCVGCKHLHLLGANLAKERNIPMIVWSNSPLEYSPFLALKLTGDGENQLKRESNKKGAVLLVKELLKTKEFPLTFFKYFETCFNGCLAAFPTSPYLQKKFPELTSVFFYDYHNWDPKKIRKYVKTNAGWKFPDGKEDWHSDCLFNYFKEYMFLSMYGASYTDAFLSNQIRFGLITREEALSSLEAGKKTNSIEIFEALKALNLSYLNEKINPGLFMQELK